jgi:DNA-binding CsgD family transcriptional regulator
VGAVDLAETIGLVYEAAVDVKAWPRAAEALADVIGAREVSVIITDPESPAKAFVIDPRTDAQWSRAYIERWAVSDFLRERGTTLPVGHVYQFEDLGMARREFERTPFYNEFFAARHLNYALFANAAKEGRAVSGVGFYRSRKDGRFDHAEEQLLRVLAPHLQRAVALNLHLARIEMQRDAAAEMLNRCGHGAILVDAQARVLFANRFAEELLSRGRALRVRDGRLAAAAPAVTEALRALIAGARDEAGGQLLALPRRGGGRLVAEVLPVRAETAWLPQPPAAIIFVKDPQARKLPTSRQLRLLFDLTPAQAALAREILHGDGVNAAASRLGIARATARTHLLEVFRKTGTSHQAELVRVILQQSLPAS